MAGIFDLPPRGGLAARTLLGITRPRVFISYHHLGDQWYYNEFSRFFAETFEVFEDRSLERTYGSDDMDYVRWAVANNDIKGTSCTIVLCGSETFQRKFVDWEIKATLDDQHGLVGIALPSAPRTQDNKVVVPERLHSNIDSGYAVWGSWERATVENVRAWIDTARFNAANRANWIVNPRELKSRNG